MMHHCVRSRRWELLAWSLYTIEEVASEVFVADKHGNKCIRTLASWWGWENRIKIADWVIVTFASYMYSECELVIEVELLCCQNLGQKTTLSEFIASVADMNEGENFASDRLRELYEAIVIAPLHFEM